MKPFTKSMFENELAEFYDFMRTFRNYDLECKFADEMIKSYSPNARNILDICCGTGEHAIRMAQRGYTVTGVDASQDMINIAQEKTNRAGVSVRYERTDIRDFKPSAQYDAAYCLGYTFLYMLTHTDVLEFFDKVKNVLIPGGVFLVDFMNGWSFLKEPSRDKFFYQAEGLKIFQFEQATLNKQDRLIHIEYCYLIDREGEQIKTIFAEEDLRIFFADEVQTLMKSSDFKNIKSFGDYSINEKELTDIPNIVIIVAQK